MNRKDDILYQHIEKLVHYLGYLETLRSKCCSLSIVQSASILAIGNARDLSVNGLADELRLDKSTASRHVTNLVDLGFVKREESQEDRRYFVLSLTESGRSVYQLIQDATQKYYDQLFSQLEPDDKDKLQQGLSALLSIIEKADCC